jgi:hypothetical protein
VANNQRDGARRGAAALVTAGPDEQARQEVIWRDLAGRAERRIALAEVPRAPHPAG